MIDYLLRGPCHVSLLASHFSLRRGVLIGEVEPGELAVELAGDAVVGAGGLDLRGEAADGDHLAVEADGRIPPMEDIVVRDALEPGGVAARPAVVAVFQLGADAHVAAAVVQAVGVDVIDDHAGGRLHDLTMHPDASALLVTPDVVLAVAAADAPFVLLETPEVACLQDAEFVLGQGDETNVVAPRRPAGTAAGALLARTEAPARSIRRDARQLAEPAGAVDADEQGPPAVLQPAGIRALAATRRYLPDRGLVRAAELKIPRRRGLVRSPWSILSLVLSVLSHAPAFLISLSLQCGPRQTRASIKG